ncbi:MAG TPA: hypothetical protein VHR45_01550 [Thermoanaerobaculia bacterium]|nr:hypothetical protein [Thermoanaerobaculia bacterium]
MKAPAALALSLSLALSAVTARAQHGAGGSPLVTSAPAEAKQFDFLLGQWEIVAYPQVSMLAAAIHGAPKLPGTWKAWRAFDGFGVEDEMRLSDDEGNPRSFTHGMRVFDRAARRWTSTTLDVYRARFQAATVEWRDGQMAGTANTSGDDGRPVAVRVRFYDIKPNSFRWQQDRSYDGGRTWDKATLRIEATRTAGAARP